MRHGDLGDTHAARTAASAVHVTTILEIALVVPQIPPKRTEHVPAQSPAPGDPTLALQGQTPPGTDLAA